MTQVFLNHKTEEKKIVLSVKEHLTDCLIKSWVDSDDMHGGVKLSTSILEGIATSRYFVAFISYRYVRSNWCMRELEEADRYALDNKVTIVPVLLNSRDELKLDELASPQRVLLDSILSRYKWIAYNEFDPIKSAIEIADAIGKHEGIKFAPVVRKTIGGVDLQLIQFQVIANNGSLPTDMLCRWSLNIEPDFLAYAEGDKKPLRAGKPVAISGKGPNWLYAYLTVPFKNLCPVYVFNQWSNEYICVYDIGSARQLGSVLKGD